MRSGALKTLRDFANSFAARSPTARAATTSARSDCQYALKVTLSSPRIFRAQSQDLPVRTMKPCFRPWLASTLLSPWKTLACTLFEHFLTYNSRSRACSSKRVGEHLGPLRLAASHPLRLRARRKRRADLPLKRNRRRPQIRAGIDNLTF